jgi:hypothetical protein
MLIIIVVVLAAAAAAFITGNWPGSARLSVAAMNSSLNTGSHGSLALFGAQAGGGAVAQEDSPGGDDESEAEPPADEGSDESVDEGGNGEGSEAEEAGDQDGDDGSSTEAEDGSAEDESGAGADEDGSGEEEESADEEAAAEEGAADEEAAAEEEEEAASDDPVENFKNLDPRDIINKKYDDLDERKTEPWDQESEGFIPNTGRPDPLTPVLDSLPDELKQMRKGNTDMNEINTYLVAAQASMVVDTLSSIIQCHNVIQIGLERYATFTFGDDTPASIPEGSSFGFNAGNVNGIPIIATLTVTSISTSQVTMEISAAGQGTTTTVSKTKVFIPSKYY